MIEKREVYLTPFKTHRTLHIYLPDYYYDSDERFPVMYMYDGHNLFRDEDATYGKSWGLESFMNTYNKQLIIVGIECNHEGNKRLEEFCPYDVTTSFAGDIKGQGQRFNDWLVHELKPFIDQTYRTYPFRECTAIGGSSMGGLMAMHAVLAYNDYISKAACLSPAIGFCFDAILNEIHDLNADTKVYMDIGNKEVRNVNGLSYIMDNFLTFNHILGQRGASCFPRIVIGGKHNEETWEKSNPIYMNYLWKE